MMLRRLMPTPEEAVAPHEVIEKTLEALPAPAVLVTSFQRAILYCNQRAQTMFGTKMQPENDIQLVYKELGWDWETSAMGQHLDGEPDSEVVVVEHGLDLGHFFACSSWLPEVPEWPPALLFTAHHTRDAHRATEVHMRDRLAVIQAVMLDQIRSETFEAARAGALAYRKVDTVLHAHIERMQFGRE